MCANCGQGHRADAQECPKRKKFGPPKGKPTPNAPRPAAQPGSNLPAGAQGSSFVHQDQRAQQTPGAGSSASVHFEPAAPAVPITPAFIEEVPDLDEEGRPNTTDQVMRDVLGSPSGGSGAT